jgi:ribosome-binding factor A
MDKKEKLNSAIQHELNNIIFKELDIFPGTLLTLTRVECSANFFEVKVYVSVFPEESFEKIFDLLNRHIYSLQQSLNKKLKIRPVPKIIFKREDKIIEANRVEQLLMEIEKEQDKQNNV